MPDSLIGILRKNGEIEATYCKYGAIETNGSILFNFYDTTENIESLIKESIDFLRESVKKTIFSGCESYKYKNFYDFVDIGQKVKQVYMYNEQHKKWFFCENFKYGKAFKELENILEALESKNKIIYILKSTKKESIN